MVFGWLKQASINQSKKNISSALKELVVAATEADVNIQHSGGATNQADIDRVMKLQKSLLFELAGPIPLDEVKREFIQPIVSEEHIADGVKMAVCHVFETAIKQRQL